MKKQPNSWWVFYYMQIRVIFYFNSICSIFVNQQIHSTVSYTENGKPSDVDESAVDLADQVNLLYN